MSANEEFDENEVKQIVNEIMVKILSEEKSMKTENLKKWTGLVVKEVLEELSKMKKSFKYIVTCTIDQRDGAGICSQSSCCLDNETDIITTFRWDNEAMLCIVSVYAFGIN